MKTKEYEPTYIAIYKLTSEGEKLAKRGISIEDMIKEQHYNLFTIMEYKDLVKYNLTHKIAEIIYRKKTN